MSASRQIAELERWALNALYPNERLFRVRLSDMIDEQGYGYGPDGTSLFVEGLRATHTRDALKEWLERAYRTRLLESFDGTIGWTSGSPIGHMYFTPWEEGRVRPLAKFLGSGRAGPTPPEFLDPVVDRLYGLLTEIRRKGFHQMRRPGRILRIYTLVSEAGLTKHVVRDGNHRASVLSHLGVEDVLACYEHTHFAPSAARRLLRRNAGPEQAYLSIVREDEAATWPHVRNGDVDEAAARKFFQVVFERSRQADGHA
jgi:hypothetical protein